jgi:hypothetical protein
MNQKIGTNMEMVGCIKCGYDMPALRFALYGFKSCVNCSTTERVGGVPITNHKTGNTIQIVPKSVAENLIRLSQRQGYGVCKGMKHN